MDSAVSLQCVLNFIYIHILQHIILCDICSQSGNIWYFMLLVLGKLITGVFEITVGAVVMQNCRWLAIKLLTVEKLPTVQLIVDYQYAIDRQSILQWNLLYNSVDCQQYSISNSQLA